MIISLRIKQLLHLMRLSLSVPPALLLQGITSLQILLITGGTFNFLAVIASLALVVAAALRTIPPALILAPLSLL